MSTREFELPGYEYSPSAGRNQLREIERHAGAEDNGIESLFEDGRLLLPGYDANRGVQKRENAGQFSLLVAVNAFVGLMVGLERAVLPLVGRESFHLASSAAVLSFIVAFGFSKAFTNLGAGGSRGGSAAGGC